MRCLPMNVKAKSQGRDLFVHESEPLMRLRRIGVFLWRGGNDDLLREMGKCDIGTLSHGVDVRGKSCPGLNMKIR